MNILDHIKDHFLLLDGGMGTLLQASGLKPGEAPERLNLTDPALITSIHRRYYEAGSSVVLTNTFGANPFHFEDDELDRIIEAAVNCAGAARDSFSDGKPRFVALDIGPSGRLLKPYGDLDFEDAVAAFSRIARRGAACGADLVMIETMNDSYETKTALLGVKEACSLPVFVSNAYGRDGKLMTGASPAAMVAMLESMGADAVGVNCSFGPEELAPVVEQYLSCASVPVLLKPNAGLPEIVGGRTVYDIAPEAFADALVPLIRKGVRIAGGCCGTTPDYVRALSARLEAYAAELPARPAAELADRTLVSSYTHAVDLNDRPVLIGERINPTGKKRFAQALKEHDVDYILNEGLKQADSGAHILDVNVGLPGIDEAALLKEAVFELQTVTDLPLQIDTADPAAMEQALRIYNGKALINSVNGKAESMAAVFPLVRKYGGSVIALTLDESGIPATADGRVAIARRIMETAASYGISKKDLIFDTLTMTVSADPQAALVTLEAMQRIEAELGCHTSLGVSNVSFGLPGREVLNGTFFALALERGLSAAILNVNSPEMMKVYYAYRALHGLDEQFGEYIGAVPRLLAASPAPAAGAAGPAPEPSSPDASALFRAISRGLKDQAAELAAGMLADRAPLEIVNREIIPALDAVGKSFEEKRTYLPQLLMSAEAASAAFEKIKAALPVSAARGSRCSFVLATVEGDIHDIGKNIVRLLLENYGFDVIDLGKDVPPQKILEAVLAHRAPLAGLSALMTTTVPAMERTIALLHEQAPFCRVVVGGAVLTQEYADLIGADAYAKEAMDTVRWAEEENTRLQRQGEV